MATGAPDSNGIWIYGEDDSEATFSALINKLGTSASSALTTKLNALPGKILKIANTSTNTQVNSSSSTFVDAGLSITFTPVSSTSKIIVMTSINGISKNASGSTTAANIELRKNSTSIHKYANNIMYEIGNNVGWGVSGTYVETSGSTSARTFAVYFQQAIGAGTVNLQRDAAVSTMTIIEVSQ